MHAGQNEDFAIWDGVLLCRKNHALILPSNTGPGSLWRYIHALIRAAEPDHAGFREIAIADINMLETLASDPPRRLRFDIGAYSETLRQINAPSKTLRKEPWLAAILQQERMDVSSMLSAPNVRREISVSIDGRKKGIQGEDLLPFCRDLLEEEVPGFVIETKSGQRVRPSDAVLRRTVHLPAQSRTVERKGALDEMVQYFDEISETGALEQ